MSEDPVDAATWAEPAAQKPLTDSASAGSGSETPVSIYICASAQTDVGCSRPNNEDAFAYDQAKGIYVVCDGMGGGPHGELSSSMAADTIRKSFIATEESGFPVSVRLLRAFEDANAAVWQTAQTPGNKGMGTTAVAAAVGDGRFIVGNVGDSRAYLLKRGRCTQLTVDHSYVNELIRSGALAAENAHTAELKGMESVICRAVGVAPTVEPDFFSVEMEHGTAILLVTDGLTRYLLQDEIASVIAASSFDTACANLIAVAKQRGGIVNITCMLLLAVAPDASSRS